MTKTQQILISHPWGSTTMARKLTAELQRRTALPRTVSRQMVWFWRKGIYVPTPLMLEWLRDNALDADVRALVVSLLEAQAEPEPIPA